MITTDAKKLGAVLKEGHQFLGRTQHIRGLLLEATPGAMIVTATDLEFRETRHRLPASGEGEWTAYVHGKTLAGLLPTSGTVGLDLDGMTLVATAGSKRGTVQTLPVEDWTAFPAFSSPEQQWRGTLAITEAELHRLLSVEFAASRDDTRPILCTVRLERRDDQVLAVATDTYRLARAWGDGAVTGKLGLQFHTSAAALMLKHLRADSEDPCALVWTDNCLTCIIRSGEAVVRSRLVEGCFPNFDRVVPPAGEWAVRVNPGRLAEALKELAPVAAGGAHRIVATVGRESLTLRAVGAETGSAVAVVSCKTSGELPEDRKAFNGAYMREWLAGATGPVMLEGSGWMRPYTLREVGQDGPDGAAAYVLMPMEVEVGEAKQRARKETEARVQAAKAEREAADKEEPAPEAVDEWVAQEAEEAAAEEPENTQVPDTYAGSVAGDDEEDDEAVLKCVCCGAEVARDDRKECDSCGDVYCPACKDANMQEGEDVCRECWRIGHPYRWAVIEEDGRAWAQFGTNLPLDDKYLHLSALPPEKLITVAREVHARFGMQVIVTGANGYQDGYTLPEVNATWRDHKGAVNWYELDAVEQRIADLVKAAEA